MFEVLDPDDPELALRDRVAAELTAFWELPVDQCTPQQIDRFFRLRRVSLDPRDLEPYRAVIARMVRAAGLRHGESFGDGASDARTTRTGTSPGPVAAAADDTRPPLRDPSPTIDGLGDPLQAVGNRTGPPGFDAEVRPITESTPAAQVLKRAGSLRRGPRPVRDTDPIVVPSPQLTVSSLDRDVLAIEWAGFTEGQAFKDTLRRALAMRARRGLRFLVLDMRGASALTRDDAEWYQRWLLTLRGPKRAALLMPIGAPSRFQMTRILRDLDAARAQADGRILPLGIARSIGEALTYLRESDAHSAIPAPLRTTDSPVAAVEQDDSSSTSTRRPLGFDKR